VVFFVFLLISILTGAFIVLPFCVKTDLGGGFEQAGSVKLWSTSYYDPTYDAFLNGTFTPTGSNVTINPEPDVSLTFASVTSAGFTYVNETVSGPAVPVGFKSWGPFHDIWTTAGYSGSITVRMTYNASGMTPAVEQSLAMWHFNQTTLKWMNITTQLDTVHNLIYGVTYSLSMFGITSSPEGGVGITGYKLVFNEVVANSLGYSATIDYYWSFSIDKWNGAQWVASGISGSSTLVTNYPIPAQPTFNLPYYVYVLPSSGPNVVVWGDWLRIAYTFHWVYDFTSYSTDYTTKLHVHPSDIAGVASITFPYLGADNVCNIKDTTPISLNWQQPVPGGTDPTSSLARADINGNGIVNISDVTPISLNWQIAWTNTPPP